MNAPVFGASSGPYQQPGDWQVSLTTRNLVSRDHYRGTEEQVERQTLQNYVTNRQNLVDLTISRTVSRGSRCRSGCRSSTRRGHRATRRSRCQRHGARSRRTAAASATSA